MNRLSAVKCLVIIAEFVLQQRLLEDLSEAGARGWTLTAAQGQGPRGRRISEIEGGNVRIEVLGSSEVIDRIWVILEERYFPNYAVAAWSHDVNVARRDRYVDDSNSEA
jgi:hypothetical protein